MKNLKFAVLGTGFWASYQLAGWKELDGAEPIALYNRTRSKADELGRRFHINNAYDNLDELLDMHAAELDFVDIITDVDTHAFFTRKVAERGLAVVCQKPMAPTLDSSKTMVNDCRRANVPFFIHENFRWQTPIRKVKEILDSGVLGRIFKANVVFCSGFPVFENQPFLKELEEFILTDVGSHILDICRFLFGEVQSLYCHTDRINPAIKGEDVANVLMRMQNGISCFAEMSYASIPAQEVFPQTLLTIEGDLGTLQLLPDYMLKIATRNGTKFSEAKPRSYPWIDPAYAVVHASIVDCNRNILAGLQGLSETETTGDDNFETIRLVHAAYQSARENKLIFL